VPTIGTLIATRDGAWAGPIFVAGHEMKIKLVPNDNRANLKAPAFRIYAGSAELGAAWARKDRSSREYFGAEIDFPGLESPISFAVFLSEDASKARLFWSRQKFEG
jgi:uncharacterized protein (DUF736 family)